MQERRKRGQQVPQNLFKRTNLLKSHWDFNPGDGPIGQVWNPINDPLPKLFPKVPYDTERGMSKSGRYKLRRRCKTNMKACEVALSKTSTKTQKLASVQMEALKSLGDLKREYASIDSFLKARKLAEAPDAEPMEDLPERCSTAPASYDVATRKWGGVSSFFVSPAFDIPRRAGSGSPI